MHHQYMVFAAIVASLLGLIGNVPYFIDIFRHKTKPERAMWWIYTVLFTVLFLAQLNAGAKWLLVVSGGYVVSSALIAMLSIRYGYGSFHRRDIVSFGVAAFGLVLWAIMKNPLIAILLVILVDFAGFWLTLVKTWHAPHSETLITWQLSCISAILSLFTIGSWDITLVIYPLYAVVATGLFVWLIIYRRTIIKEDPVDF
jgi:hypothetical protein